MSAKGGWQRAEPTVGSGCRTAWDAKDSCTQGKASYLHCWELNHVLSGTTGPEEAPRTSWENLWDFRDTLSTPEEGEGFMGENWEGGREGGSKKSLIDKDGAFGNQNNLSSPVTAGDN